MRNENDDRQKKPGFRERIREEYNLFREQINVREAKAHKDWKDAKENAMSAINHCQEAWRNHPDTRHLFDKDPNNKELARYTQEQIDAIRDRFSNATSLADIDRKAGQMIRIYTRATEGKGARRGEGLITSEQMKIFCDCITSYRTEIYHLMGEPLPKLRRSDQGPCCA